jgi:hypothetical protein
MAKHKPTQATSVCSTKSPSLLATKLRKLRKTQCIFNANYEHERQEKKSPLPLG